MHAHVAFVLSALLAGACLSFARLDTAQAQPPAEPIEAPDENQRVPTPHGVRPIYDQVFRVVDTPAGPRALMLNLYLPPRADPRQPHAERPALVVWIHGGGWMNGNRNRLHVPWLAGEGYALASIEYRYSHEAPFPAQLHDVKAAVRWLIAHADDHGYDASRLAIGGPSAGGHLAALLGAAANNLGELEEDGAPLGDLPIRIAGVMSFYGPTDVPAMIGEGPRGPAASRALERLLGGPLDQKLDLARAASAVTYLDADDPPFLLTHGDSDPVVDPQQSRRFHAKLQELGVDSELHMLPGQRHGGPLFFGLGPSYQRILKFLQRVTAQAPTTDAVAAVSPPRPRPVIVRPQDEQPPEAPDGFAVIRNIVYRTAPGRAADNTGPLELMLDLYLPPHAGVDPPMPLVVFFHGEGWMEGTRHRMGLRWLLERGYAMASVEYRYSHDAPFPAPLLDAKAAIRWLRAHAADYGYDADRIAAAGTSAGGTLAALLATTAGVEALEADDAPTTWNNVAWAGVSSRIAAALSFYGPSAFDYFADHPYPAPVTQQAVESFLSGPVRERLDVARLASAGSHATPDDPPIFVCHGELDPIVPADMSRHLHQQLREAGVEAQLVILPEGMHGNPPDVFWRNDDLRGQIDAFLDKHMQHTPPLAEPRPLNPTPEDRTPPDLPPGARSFLDIPYRVAPGRDGDLQLRLDIHLPPPDPTVQSPRARAAQEARRKLPVIVWLHGGGWQDGSRYRLGMRWMLRHGYALASVEYRLSHNAPFPAQLLDAKAAIRWLRVHAEDYHLDPDRIAVAGDSAGGTLAALLGTTAGQSEFVDADHADQRDDVQAVINLFGLTNFEHLAKAGYPSRPTQVAVEALLGGPIDEKLDLARLASAVHQARGGEPAFLNIHGEVDPIVPVEMSRQLHQKLTSRGVESHLHIVEGGGHGDPGEKFAGDKTVRQRIEDLLERHLGQPARSRARFPMIPDDANSPRPRTIESTRVDANVVYATRWTRHGMVDLRLDLYRPPAEQQPAAGFPLVLWMHGGGWVQGDKHHCPLTWMPQHGYAVASIEYRFTQEAPWPATIQDCHAALDWLIEHAAEYGLDPARIAVSGGSSGAHLAALVGAGRDLPDFRESTNATPPVRAIASYFAPADLTLFTELGYPSVHTQFYTELLLGGPLEQRMDVAQRASVCPHVDADDPPMLIVHGSDDPLLPPELARRLHATCQRVGVPSDLVILEGASHGQPRDVFFTGEQARQRLLDFLARHMP